MIKSKEELKKYFETGDKPTQQQYAELIDSYVHMTQKPGEENRRFVINKKGEVSVTTEKKESEYTLSDVVNNKLSLLKDGVPVKEINLPVTESIKKEYALLSYNYKGGVIENNIAGVITDTVVKTSGFVGENLFSTMNGVAFFEYIAQVYTHGYDELPSSSEDVILPSKVELNIYLESNNALFSNSFRPGGQTTKKILLVNKELKNDVRDINQLFIDERIPIITNQNAFIKKDAQWSIISYNQSIDKVKKEVNEKLYYLRSLDDTSVFSAKDLNIQFVFELKVHYKDAKNSEKKNSGFGARLNTFSFLINKVK